MNNVKNANSYLETVETNFGGLNGVFSGKQLSASFSKVRLTVRTKTMLHIKLPMIN